MAKSYPALTAELVEQLAAVPITDGMYCPSRVVLDDGTTLDRVYMVEAAAFLRSWGANVDEEGTGRAFVPVQRIVGIASSPSRLPPKAADKLYASGESVMGVTIFTVCFRDGSRMAVVSGNAVDFVDYPAGQSPETVVDVLPHAGRDGLRICWPDLPHGKQDTRERQADRSATRPDQCRGSGTRPISLAISAAAASASAGGL